MSVADGPKPRRSHDWRRAARLMATGMPAETIAADMGIDEEHIWRHLRRSARFRYFVLSAVYGKPRPAGELVNLVTDKHRIESK